MKDFPINWICENAQQIIKNIKLENDTMCIILEMNII